MPHLVFCLRRLPHLTREQFQDYWRNTHGPLVVANSDAMGLSGYLQTHALPEDVNSGLAVQRGTPPSFDGIAQVWWHARTLDDAQKMAAREANALLLEDERRFIDLLASPLFFAEDHELLRLFAEARSL